MFCDPLFAKAEEADVKVVKIEFLDTPLGNQALLVGFAQPVLLLRAGAGKGVVGGIAEDYENRFFLLHFSGGIAFVFGAEGKGLRPLVKRTCDLEVSIPQLGLVESLNVSVAAAVLLYEARRQRNG